MVLVVVAVHVVTPVLLFRARYCRTVVLRDLGVPSTQTVSIAFLPSHVSWSVSAQVEGAGTLLIPGVLSNTVSGRFSTNGAGDYYATNLTVIFSPQGAARGKVRASFCFSDFY